jgi:hypothetical protein
VTWAGGACRGLPGAGPEEHVASSGAPCDAGDLVAVRFVAAKDGAGIEGGLRASQAIMVQLE